MSGTGGARTTILVADDETVSRMIAARTVEKAGFAVVQANCGEAIRRALAEHPEIRLIVLDWMMPDESGVDVCEWLRAQPRGSEYYLVLLTARDRLEDLEKAIAAGADDFLSKPLEPRALIARIRAGVRILGLQCSLAGKVAELERALAEVRELQGLIPICMRCRRIRTGSEEWKALESYIDAHGEGSFGHALCGDCLRSLPPGPTST